MIWSLLNVSIDRACSVTALMLMRLEASMSLSCNLLAWEGGKSCSVGYFTEMELVIPAKFLLIKKLHSWIAMY